MKEDRDTLDKIQMLLRAKGFVATEIEPGTERSPDLFVTGNGRKFLVEVKTRIGEVRPTVATEGGVEVIASRVERTNPYQNIVRDAVNQLKQPSNPAVDHRLVWIDIDSQDKTFDGLQFKFSLYGLKLGVPNPSGKTRPVFFCDFSDFHRFRNILAGVIISSGDNIEAHYNPLYPHLSNLQASGILTGWSTFGESIYSLEKSGEVFIADFDIDRADQEGVSKALAKKYGSDFMFLMPMSRIGVRSWV